MIINLCTACRRVNALGARRCQGCGALLEELGAQSRRLKTSASPGAIWLDDLVPRPGDALAAPAPPAPAVPDLPLNLLDIDTTPAATAAPPASTPDPDIEELVLSDPQPRPALIFPELEAPASAGPRKAAPSRIKVERRAAVRRGRLRGRKAAAAEPAMTEVLVCDGHEGERGTLGRLLRRFGFKVHAVNRAEEAMPLLASRHFAAAFVDIALDESDGGAGIALCRQLRDLDRRRGAHTLLVLASASLQPMERVRAQMAGCDEILVKPATRGSLAGVLDRHSVVLPADPRRG